MITRTIRNFYCYAMQTRGHKNFGHKPVPMPRITVYWSCFLTFNMVAVMLDWKKIGRFIFGEEAELSDDPSSSRHQELESSIGT